VFSIWKNRVGDPDTEAGRAFLSDRSPLNHVDRATKPMLIAQACGTSVSCRPNRSRWSRAEGEKACRVTYVTFADEGHGFAAAGNRRAFDAVAEAFLASHLAAASAVGDDFAGSTIQRSRPAAN